MQSAIWAAIGRRTGSLSGKFVSEVAGSALAIIAVTTLSGQFRTPPKIGELSGPSYRPTLDPSTGKIVDRLATYGSNQPNLAPRAVATFVVAPRFVAADAIPPWAASRVEVASRSRFNLGTLPETPKATLAGFVPLPPSRTAAVTNTPPVEAEPPREPAKPTRLAQAAAWLSPGWVVEGGAQALANGRETIFRAVSYGGDALGRIYR